MKLIFPATQAFIPYTHVFTKALAESPLISEHHCPHGTETEFANSIFVHANVTKVTKRYVEVDRNLCDVEGITETCVVDEDSSAPMGCGAYTRAKNAGTLAEGFNCTCLNGENGLTMLQKQGKTTKIRFDYLIFVSPGWLGRTSAVNARGADVHVTLAGNPAQAVGSIMPRPLWTNSRTKRDGMQFLQDQQDVISRASSVLIVGGGALGIQYATDIADLHPSKKVTLIHSRQRLLPIFDERLHHLALERLHELGVNVILGDRVILPEGHLFEGKELDHRIIHTQGGKAIESDLQLFCTGQTPNSGLIKAFLPTAVGKDGLVKVHKSLQIKAPGHNVPHMFAIGDCIDAFGAIKAGHTGWNQGAVAAKNIVKIVEARETGTKIQPLEQYQHGPPQISISLGLVSGRRCAGFFLVQAY